MIIANQNQQREGGAYTYHLRNQPDISKLCFMDDWHARVNTKKVVKGLGAEQFSRRNL